MAKSKTNDGAEISVHPAADLFPMLSDTELADLAKDIKEHGLVHPVVMFKGVLLDGRNRLAACKIAEVEPTFNEYDGDDPIAFVISVNVMRRQLSRSQLACVAVELEPMFAVEAKKRYKETVGRPSKQSVVNLPPIVLKAKARDQAAAMVGVSSAMVQRAKAIKKADPKAFKQIMADTVTVNKVWHGMQKRKREAIKVAQNNQVEIRATVTLAECTEWLATQDLCDLLLTDPPYSTDVPDIESFSASWLPIALAKVKPTGRAYVFIGSYPEELLAYLTVAKSITGMKLENVLVWTYRNTLGPTPTNKYKNNWQACLYFVGPDAAPLDCPEMLEQFSVQDISAPDGRQGDRYHEWQKPMEIAERFIRHSTTAGQLVLDPFSGTGTHLLAAAKLGRVAHGCDISQAMIDIAVKRGCQNV
jgi:DNA modification methylase